MTRIGAVYAGSPCGPAAGVADAGPSWAPAVGTAARLITQNCLTFPLYVPRICRLWTNWPEYMIDYLLRRHPRLRKAGPAIYRMRTGVRLVDTTGTLAGTMAVVFVREEYGRLDQFKTILDIGANIG